VTLAGGNLGLRPEVADTATAGFVFTPSSLPGFAFSADYFDIYVDGYIGTVDAPTVINECIESGSEFFCNLFHRDPTLGVLFGTNGYIEATSQNTGHLQTSGVDMNSTYAFDLGKLLPGAPELGSFDLAFIGTWLNSRRIEQLPGLGSYNCVGMFGPGCNQPTPKWRHNARLTWASPQRVATVSANWRHFGSALLTSGSPDHINRRIAAYNYFDLAATWSFARSVEFRAGINNVFDRDPPMIAAGLLGSFGNGNTYPGVYDPMGRLVYFGMRVEF
jgi:outer membrane receptor protein involved in Fe transport